MTIGMQPRSSALSAILLLCGLALGFPCVARAQDPAGGQEDEIKAKELQARIKKEMAEIDELLLQAAKDSPKDAAAKIEQVKADLDKLLKDVQTKQSQAVSDIEELVRMAKQSQSKSGGSSHEKGGEGEKPDPDAKPEERPKDDDVDKLKKQNQPKDGEQKPEEHGKGDPKSGAPDKDKPEQDKSEGERPPSEKSTFERENTSGRWGTLPPKVQELFQKLSQNEFPDRYRELFRQYYQSRNKTKNP